jgi:two-component system OmpR family response regulator
VTRTRLAEAVWARDADGLANIIDVHVSHLRRKIDAGGAAPLIHTERGAGFRLGTAGP